MVISLLNDPGILN